MPTSAQILTLTQWLSPGYPVGAFAYSHGLEWAIDSGAVSDADDLHLWLADVLQHGAGHNDSLFLAAAHGAAEARTLAEIDAQCRAFAAAQERWMESDLQGDAFCRVTATIWQQELAGLTYPVAVGRAARLADLPLLLTAELYLQAFVGNLVHVGMRLLPLGQTDGQRLIHALAPICLQVAQNTHSGDLYLLGASSFLGDIAAMRHETQYSRVCRT